MSTSGSHHPLHVTMDILPPEIWQEIVEISASSSSRQAAQLSVVSSFFYRCARPILFRIFICRNYPETFVPDATWFEANGKYIRHLLWRQSIQQLPPLLSFCPNIENMAIWVNSNSNVIPALLPALSNLRLRRLSINIYALYSDTPFTIAHAREPMFQNLTHLDVLNSCFTWDLFQGFAELPRLTHITFSDNVADVIIQNLSQKCDGLRVIIVLESLEHETGDTKGFVRETEYFRAGIDDPRVVGLTCEYEGDWELGAEGKDDMWVKAEEIVDKRRAAKSI
ncbi:hypothetical protein BDN72DRAFT_962957 [Pluteus cervinus]|uniref:Uncharacterized protein n=1 Tax=Pluteus cervinus TaxID=181527 RepID=A0ACD3AGV1_9AGAR|nr:hypothetical protein BDN72DRAFT_962957 [Pluteus cervinus]